MSGCAWMLAATVAVATGMGSSEAKAQSLTDRLQGHVEVGAGAMLADYQRDDLEYGPAVLAAFRVGIELIGPLSLQGSFAYWAFPSDAGAGQQLTGSGGLRVAPDIGTLGHVFADVNLGVGRTGDRSRVALDIGLGFGFSVADDRITLGPFVRYGRLFAADEDHPSDAQFLVGGLAIRLAAPRRANDGPADEPSDQDRDGVLDVDDVCIDEPAGDTPDPDRPGCPLGDQDADGVSDRDDVCPTTPQGDHPDPERLGCPSTDSDSDGVFDQDDACPTTAAGDHPDPERPGCPDADTDGDGVYDSEDGCPEQHHGLHPDPARPGCPLPDRDGDSVPDPTDACPDEPGAPSQDPRRNGCPGLVWVQDGELRITRPVFFATNRDRILRRSRPVLEAVADAIAATPGIRRISVEGHTDDVGDDAYNLDLSRRRANNVREWLIEHGVAAERLESHGYGETCPVEEGTSRRARAANRRVQFRITDPPLSPPNTCPLPAEPTGDER